MASACFNPLTGISSILTSPFLSISDLKGKCFNPLTGISSILTIAYAKDFLARANCFNPLTGISSILTFENMSRREETVSEFQSPDGDFVYSDSLAVAASEDYEGLVSIP